MRRYHSLVVCVVAAMYLGGCQTLKGLNPWRKSDQGKQDEAKSDQAKSEGESAGGPPLVTPGNYVASPRDVELRIAKLWARVDEMEHEFFKQRERLKILEKGLMLGVIPEELKKEKGGHKAAHHEEDDHFEVELKSPAAAAQAGSDHGEASHDAKAPDDAGDSKAFQAKSARAQALFNGGHYGQAIVVYSEIGKEFPKESAEGGHLFWISVSWYQLKEYKVAAQHFEQFTKEFGASPWLPKAKLYQAKILAQTGMSDRALKGLKSLIHDYPENEIAEMAKLEIKRIEDQL